MEKRRTALWFLAAAALTAQALACNEGTKLESPRFVVAYKAEPIEVARHFALEVSVCPKPGQPQPEAVKVDAHMPEHRHGMNYRARVFRKADGIYVAEGLLFHMPGLWQLMFDVDRGGRMERLTTDIDLE